MTRSEQAITEDALKAGREALENREWARAFELLSGADAQSALAAEDVERLGEAAMWAWRPDECIDAYERAYAAYVESGNRRDAARAAIRLIAELNAKGATSVVGAWMNRVARLLRDEPECAEHGWVAFGQGMGNLGSGDNERAFVRGQAAYELGRKYGDRDLEALGLHAQGLALVAKGEVEEGMALLGEAAAAAVAGELGVLASATIYCNIVGTCRGLSDYGRASEWIDAAKRWCERTALATYPGTCRVHRAEVMRLRGVWAEAEKDARKAGEEHSDYPVIAREAFYEIGEIRLRMGDIKGAEEAFTQAQEMGRDPQPGLAMVRLIRGQTGAAAAMIKRALAEQATDRLARARLLPAQVEIALATGEAEAARVAVEEMEGIAETYGTEVLRALAGCARGALQLHEGDYDASLTSVRQSLRLWQEIDAPYEAARTRVSMAAAYCAVGDEASGRLELDAALSTFERLGAMLDVPRVRELLDEGKREPAKGDRVTRTFMFTDIVKSTSLVEAMGDEAWEDVLRWHDETLRSLFSTHGGEEIKHQGDGFFVAFNGGRPAIECAMAIQRGLAEHRRTQGFAPQVRIGLHASEATLRGRDYGGRGVHLAARIGALAGASEILASQETAAEWRESLAAAESHSVSLKGIAEPVEVTAIEWR